MSNPLQGHVYGSYEIYFDKFAPGTKNRTGRKRFGYIPNINLSGGTENLEGFNPDEGIPVKVAEVQTSATLGMSFTMESIDPYAIAAALLGSEAVFSQANTPVVDEAITVKQGYSYQLGAALGHGHGVRNVASVVIQDATDTTTYVLGDDYELDAEMGVIYIIEGGDIDDGDVIHVDYTPAAEDREVILSGSVAHRGELFLKANNPVGTRRDLLVPDVSLTLNGDWNLKGDNAWQQLPFTVAVNKKDSATPSFIFQGRAA